MPVYNKLKLIKKRKVSAVVPDDHPSSSAAAAAGMMNQTKPDITHIVMASRGYSKDEERQLGKMFGRAGMRGYSLEPSIVPFEGKEDVLDADKRVADILKELFRHHLPKPAPPSDFEAEEDHDDGDDFEFGRREAGAVGG